MADQCSPDREESATPHDCASADRLLHAERIGMREHLHSGFDMFVIVTVYAIIGLWVTRFIAAKALEYESTRALGKALGALVE